MQNRSVVNRNVVIRNIERADSAAVEALGAAGTATVHEAIGRQGYLGPELKPIQQDTRVGGSAITVLSHPGDNLMLHAAVECCQPGDILVVAVTAPSTHGGFGDLLASSLMAHGVRGLVTDAAVRDTADLREMGFPVWTRHISCQGTVKNTPGSVNVSVVVGGVAIQPGDVICADDDGVVVVPRSQADWAVEQTNARLAKEAAVRARLEAGELGFDFYGLRDKAVALGIEFLDSADEL
jgi:4-hydroxy-4-methyl-2-oxoglutarate aldolase